MPNNIAVLKRVAHFRRRAGESLESVVENLVENVKDSRVVGALKIEVPKYLFAVQNDAAGARSGFRAILTDHPMSKLAAFAYLSFEISNRGIDDLFFNLIRYYSDC